MSSIQTFVPVRHEEATIAIHKSTGEAFVVNVPRGQVQNTDTIRVEGVQGKARHHAMVSKLAAVSRNEIAIPIGSEPTSKPHCAANIGSGSHIKDGYTTGTKVGQGEAHHIALGFGVIPLPSDEVTEVARHEATSEILESSVPRVDVEDGDAAGGEIREREAHQVAVENRLFAVVRERERSSE